MLEKISMLGGIAGVVMAIFAIVILYLTRSNIIDLLDRDVVMYDKNYEAKKESLENAFNCLDILIQNGADIKGNPQFIQRAKEAYNGLLCTVNSAKLYQEFYRIAIDVNEFSFTAEEVENFKIECRSELITKHRNKKEGFKGNINTLSNRIANTSMVKPAQQRPAQSPRPAPTRPTQPPKQN